MTKATLTYASGWKLTFPAHSAGPRLFLEWLQKYQEATKSRKYRLTFRISTEDDIAEILEDNFVIRFDVILREDAQNCRDYITENLAL